VGIFSDDRANELRNIFFESSQEILQALNEDALLLEKSPQDPEIVRNLRRSVHTLKGDSAACGYKELSELAHSVEDVLTPETAESDGDLLVELVLMASDVFDGLLSAYRNNLPTPSVEPLVGCIDAIRNPNKRTAANDISGFHWTPEEELRMQRSATRGQRVFNLALTIDPVCPMRGAAVQLIRNMLEEVGTIVAIRPEPGSVEIPDVVQVALATHHGQEWVLRKANIPTVVSRALVTVVADVEATQESTAEEAAEFAAEPLLETLLPAPPSADEPLLPELEQPKPKPRPAAPLPQATAVAAARQAAPRASQREKDRARAAQIGSGESVLRVETERVDVVLDLVGEMIIAKSMMQDLLTEMNRELGNSTTRVRTSDVLLLQSQILNKLQRAVMKIRMVPVEQMFRRLPRVVRDAAKLTGHEVNVVIEGENTDLDKSILDALAEPLMHLLRNAVDHGIEPPAQRLAAGKPAEGTVQLNAYHQGNQVVIEISDDGSGIDLPRVVKRAVARGSITPEQAARMSDSDALELIFQAGLSTSETVTELSGRGMGMDVVKSVMDRLKGTISVRTAAGQGTTFALKVPLTLAIIKALLVRVTGRLYAVPLANVLEIIRSSESEVHMVEGCEVLQLREEVIPLVRLSRMHNTVERKTKLFIVVISFGERKVGFVVDHLIGEQELVIKALDDSMISSELVSGASILGDGRVVLILSVPDVVERLGDGLFGSGRLATEIGVGS
jgi:two-component system chemotaxis sensor kinase CheA